MQFTIITCIVIHHGVVLHKMIYNKGFSTQKMGRGEGWRVFLSPHFWRGGGLSPAPSPPPPPPPSSHAYESGNCPSLPNNYLHVKVDSIQNNGWDCSRECKHICLNNVNLFPVVEHALFETHIACISVHAWQAPRVHVWISEISLGGLERHPRWASHHYPRERLSKLSLLRFSAPLAWVN